MVNLALSCIFPRFHCFLLPGCFAKAVPFQAQKMLGLYPATFLPGMRLRPNKSLQRKMDLETKANIAVQKQTLFCSYTGCFSVLTLLPGPGLVPFQPCLSTWQSLSLEVLVFASVATLLVTTTADTAKLATKSLVVFLGLFGDCGTFLTLATFADTFACLRGFGSWLFLDSCLSSKLLKSFLLILLQTLATACSWIHLPDWTEAGWVSAAVLEVFTSVGGVGLAT